jgi:hypothetical protein
MDFYLSSAQERLEHTFDRAYRFMEGAFEGQRNPYLGFIEKNMRFLQKIKREGDWSILRRRPPCVIPDPDGETRMMTLAMRRLRELSDTERENSRRLRALDPDTYLPTPPSPT